MQIETETSTHTPAPIAQTATVAGIAPPPVMTTLEVARILRVTDRTVRQLVTDRKLKALRIGRAIRFTLENVQEFINQNTS